MILTPGSGAIEVNKRKLEEYFPRAYLQTVAKQALVQSGYEGNVDVRVRVHGGGIAGQAAAVRHGIARALCRRRPRAAPRAEAPGHADPRRPRQGAPQGGPEEGAQEASVLQALAPRGPWRSASSSAPMGSGGRSAISSPPTSRCGSGRAAALEAEAERPQVLIIRDTRESGPMLESALAAGIASAGGDAMLGGVLPSPAASILARRLDFDLAAVVSASHNPYGDNGIKFFDRSGTKLDDEAEAAIEARLDDEPAAESGRVRTLEGALDDYLRELRSRLPARPQRPPDRPRLRPRRHLPGRARDLRAPRRRGRGDRGSSPTGATSTTASAPPPRRPWPSGSPARTPRSASPSTATATA